MHIDKQASAEALKNYIDKPPSKYFRLTIHVDRKSGQAYLTYKKVHFLARFFAFLGLGSAAFKNVVAFCRKHSLSATLSVDELERLNQKIDAFVKNRSCFKIGRLQVLAPSIPQTNQEKALPPEMNKTPTDSPPNTFTACLLKAIAPELSKEEMRLKRQQLLPSFVPTPLGLSIRFRAELPKGLNSELLKEFIRERRIPFTEAKIEYVANSVTYAKEVLIPRENLPALFEALEIKSSAIRGLFEENSPVKFFKTHHAKDGTGAFNIEESIARSLASLEEKIDEKDLPVVTCSGRDMMITVSSQKEDLKDLIEKTFMLKSEEIQEKGVVLSYQFRIPKERCDAFLKCLGFTHIPPT